MNFLITKKRVLGRARALLKLAISGITISAPSIARSAPLSDQQLSLYVRECAPDFDPRVLRAVAHIESGYDPLALHNNTKHISIALSSVSASAEQASLWISKGYSVDIGLMQINSGNLSALGMTIDDALDPCRSLEAGARMLSNAYTQGATVADRQAALLIALSRYNTGHTLAGLANDYVGRVLSAHGGITKPISNGFAPTNPSQSDWDVWIVASSAQRDGAIWLVGSQNTHDFLIGAGAQPTGEPHALSQEPGTAPGM